MSELRLLRINDVVAFLLEVGAGDRSLRGDSARQSGDSSHRAIGGYLGL